MHAKQLRTEVIRPTLQAIDLWTPQAEDLLMGTAAAESRLGYFLVQQKGPAKGMFQVEPATYADYWHRFLQQTTRADVQRIRAYIADELRYDSPPPVARVVDDLRLAVVMCRVHYRRIPVALPSAGDITGYAHYWKRHYNTPAGKGRVGEFLRSYRRYVL